MWSFRTGTARVEPLVLPPHIPFQSQAAVHIYAETVAYQWVDQRQEASREQTLKIRSALTQDEQRERAATYGEYIEMPKSAREKTAIDAQG